MNIKLHISPFRFGGPVDPVHFVGRTEELQAIYHAMFNLQNISLIGEERMGKSSLLKYLADPSTNNPLPKEYIQVYFNFQEVPTGCSADVLWAIARAIDEQIRERQPVMEVKFKRVLETMKEFLASPETTAIQKLSE